MSDRDWWRYTVISLQQGIVMSAKAEAVQMLRDLPEDASFEDIQYHLYVLDKVKRGIDRADSEGEVSHSEAKERLARWLTN